MPEQDLPYELDYEALVRARGTLRAAYVRLHNAPAEDTLTARCQGIAHGAFVAAEQALFSALNNAASYLDDPEAQRVVHMTAWKPAELSDAEALEEAQHRR